MKIFYAVQATGNGHISRAMELLPHLQQYGTVDIFLSGDNSNLPMDAPVKYRSKGLSLYYNCSGGLDYWQILKSIHPLRLRQEIRDLPVEKYDLVLNDFEYITASACAKKKVFSVNFGHQASFQSAHTPRPQKRNISAEYLLKNYAKADRYIGLHFKKYDRFIFPPVVKKEILDADPSDQNYITVYLPSYCEPQLKQVFEQFPGFRFEIFCRGIKQAYRSNNIQFLPVHKTLFNKSLIHCSGIITGAGFETPAEALQLGKKMICIPIRGQYEQQCNASALEQHGVLCLKNIEDDFKDHFYRWIYSDHVIQANYSDSIPQCLDHLFSSIGKHEKEESLAG